MKRKSHLTALFGNYACASRDFLLMALGQHTDRQTHAHTDTQTKAISKNQVRRLFAPVLKT